MADKKATREAYGEALCALADKYDFFVLDADLAKATKTDLFKKVKPERFMDCGIAEANMMSVAAGIASTGTPVFASTFAMFAAGRAFDPVRNSIGYPHLNVKIGATHAGLTVGEDGATHQCNEDMALMRVIPGMTVICPADEIETKAAVEAALNIDGPVYLRLGRAPVPAVNSAAEYSFKAGKGIVLADGSDVAIFATGYMVHLALEARELLAAEGIDAAVINIHTIKPLDEELIIKYAKKTGALVTAEEHNILAGFGAAVCEVVSENCPVVVKRVGVKDTFGRSGTVAAVLERYGLTARAIYEGAKAAIAKK